MNMEPAHYNMVRQQIRTWDVTDDTILDTIAQTPRHAFVPAAYQDVAFADMQIPLAHGQCMLSPKTEGKMLQDLVLQSHETVLEIGTGSGYFTALLSQLTRKVHTVDIHADLSGIAQHHCQQAGYRNIQYHVADAARGFNDAGEVDVIVITGALPFLPEAFQATLKPGGRIMAIVGDAPAMEVVIIRQATDNTWFGTSLFETEAPVLDNATQPDRFIF